MSTHVRQPPAGGEGETAARELSSAGLTVMHTRLVPVLWAAVGLPALALAAWQGGLTLTAILVVVWVALAARFVTTARHLWHVALTPAGSLHMVSGMPVRAYEVPLAAVRQVIEGRAPGGSAALTLVLDPERAHGLPRVTFIPRHGTYRLRRNPTAAELRELVARAGGPPAG